MATQHTISNKYYGTKTPISKFLTWLIVKSIILSGTNWKLVRSVDPSVAVFSFSWNVISVSSMVAISKGTNTFLMSTWPNLKQYVYSEDQPEQALSSLKIHQPRPQCIFLLYKKEGYFPKIALRTRLHWHHLLVYLVSLILWVGNIPQIVKTEDNFIQNHKTKRLTLWKGEPTPTC